MVRDYDTAIVNLLYTSGFIVDKHIIATAAHCVYRRADNSFTDFDIKLEDKNNNKSTIKPKYVDICKRYNEPTLWVGDYDYALIYVEEDLSQYGKLKMGVALDEYADNHGEVIVSGFPANYPDDYKGQPYGLRFKAKGKITSYNETRFGYDADALAGESGGPVFVQESFDNNDYNTVIAINFAASISHENFGLRITPDMLKFYYDNPNIDY